MSVDGKRHKQGARWWKSLPVSSMSSGRIRTHLDSLEGLRNIFRVATVHRVPGRTPTTPPPLGRAIQAAIDVRGLSKADFIRQLGWKESTVRNLIDGPTRQCRDPELRQRLDEFFDAEPGTTMRIGRDGEGAYPTPPSDWLRQLVLLAPAVADEALEHLVAFIRIVTRND